MRSGAGARMGSVLRASRSEGRRQRGMRDSGSTGATGAGARTAPIPMPIAAEVWRTPSGAGGSSSRRRLLKRTKAIQVPTRTVELTMAGSVGRPPSPERPADASPTPKVSWSQTAGPRALPEPLVATAPAVVAVSPPPAGSAAPSVVPPFVAADPSVGAFAALVAQSSRTPSALEARAIRSHWSWRRRRLRRRPGRHRANRATRRGRSALGSPRSCWRRRARHRRPRRQTRRAIRP